MRSCPRCAEEIRVEATRCRHCLSDVRDPSHGEVITAWIRSHNTLTLSLITFLVVVFQIYKAAGFEVNSTVELLRAGGLSTIVVGVLLVLLPIELVLLSLAGCWWILAVADSVTGRPAIASGRFELDPRAAPMVALASAAALGLWTNPWPLWLICVAVSTVSVWRAIRQSDASSGGTRWLRRTIAGLAMVFGYLLLQRPTIWVPAEVLTIEGRGHVVAYVIADDGQWATLLTPDHKLLRQDTRRILDRQFCAVEYLEAKLFDRALRLRPVQAVDAIAHGAMPESLTRPCPP